VAFCGVVDEKRSALNGIIMFYDWKIAILKAGVFEEILYCLSLRDEL
jgi:hypothetical protein